MTTSFNMNIGIDIRPLMSPVRSGVGEYTYELLNAIFTIDTENQYFLFYNSHTDVSANIPSWPQHNIHYVHKKWPNKLFNLTTKLFNAPKVDAIIQDSISPAPRAPLPQLDYFFSPNFGFTALSKKTNRILTVHDLSFEIFPEFFSLKQRVWHRAINPKKQCEQADTIICPSENTKRDIISLYKIPAEKIKIIYPGVQCQSAPPTVIPVALGDRMGEKSVSNQSNQTDRDPSSARASLGMTDSAIRLKQKYNLPNKFMLFLGTVEPRKNIIGLIEAFEQACSSLPMAYSLVIAGYRGWNDKKIYQRFLSSPVKDKIKFIGAVEATDKSTLYAMSDLFIYPSFYEGFGFPPIEAMACGTPVITSNRSSLPEITNSAAYLVNPNRPSEFAQAITEVLKNEKLREHFKNQGLEQAKKFNWNRSAKEFLNLLTQQSI